MKKKLPLFFIFIPYLLFAQVKRVVIEGRVSDTSHNPIAYVAIQNTSTSEGTTTDAKGHYSFITTLPASLKVSIIGYKTLYRTISSAQGNDTLRIDFVLEVDNSQLEQVEVTGIHPPELLKESGDLIDFELGDKKIWLLNHWRKGDHLELYDTGVHYLARIVLKHHSDNINKTLHGIVYIENSDSVRMYSYKPTTNLLGVSSMFTGTFHFFSNNLRAFHLPCYYYLWTREDSAAIIYWYFNNRTKTTGMLYYYSDKNLSRVNTDLIGTIDYLSSKLKNEGGESMAMTEVGEAQEQGESVFADSKTKPANSRAIEDAVRPLKAMVHTFACSIRIVRDSIYIFNFDNDSIIVFNHYNERVRQMPLSFRNHGIQYKEKDILVDEEQKECYFKFVLGVETYLEKIDLGTGKAISTEKLGLLFPEKIRIMSGYAYYTTSGYETNRMFIKHLYRQKLSP